mmetsp:Transcript_6292/g.11463  ORF Transcript_6292/g.11463 Transcript_6292/m.11463 type:complete len:123 (-) Transcript_6292:1009-1377(-)
MPSCHLLLSVGLLFLSVAQIATSFVSPFSMSRPTTLLRAKEETIVEVCGFKDCKRAGGGSRLQKLVKEVVEEKGMTNLITVEACDCQGECGYGPNLVVNGKIKNGVKGKDAVLKALGIEEAY